MTTTITLGDTEITRIGLGTNRLTNTPANVAFLHGALAAGVSFVDTAHLYTSGASEETIGTALAPFAAGTVVATKGGYHPGEGRPEVIRAQIDSSLARLRTDTISLYYLHRVHAETPLEDSLAAIADARQSGKIRHVGISEVNVEQIERARKVVPIAAVQNHYNLSERTHDAVVDHCAREGLLFVPFFPLRGDAGPALDEIATSHGATASQVTLAWLLRRSPAMVPIPGTLSLDHLRENLAALELELTDAEFDTLSRPPD